MTRAKAKRAKKRGPNALAGAGDRTTKTQIARRTGLDRATVSKYLEMEGAPRPDKGRRYSLKDCVAFFAKVSPRAANTEVTQRLKESLLQMEAEDKGIDLGIKKGRYIERSKIEPAFAKINAELTADLTAKFKHELPSKYKGRSEAECSELNMDAVVWVLERLKVGQAIVTPSSP